MIKFFRKIRYDLMGENKTGKYLKYAIGEIVLVMIGILLALQVNNWNENRKETSKSLNYLNEFRKDLITDTISFNQAIVGLTRNINSEEWALKKTKYNLRDSDSILSALGRTYYDRKINTRTFSSVQNSGNSKLIGYDSLFGIISNYYIKTYERMTAHTEWDKTVVTDGQEYKQFLSSKVEVDNNYIKQNSRTINTQDFPMITDSNEQAILIINSATTVKARNHFKENYIRHLRLRNVFSQTKQEAKDLIKLIDEELIK